MNTEKSPIGRGLRWALGLSLALNLLILGALGGAAWRHAGGGSDSGRGGNGPPELRSYASAYVQALPPADRRALHDEMRNGKKGHYLDRAARRALYAQMLAALRADPFDPQDVQNVLSAQSAAVIEVQSSAHTAWLARIEQMDAPARAAYADALEERLQRGKNRKFKR